MAILQTLYRFKRYARFALVSLIALLPAGGALAWRSSLYPPNWQPGSIDGQGRFLHDFSYAGYHHSDVPLPSVSGLILDVAAQYGADPTGATDSTASIQTAIDDAETSGGAVVYFPAGLYRCDGQLTIQGDGIVLRGQGPALSRLYFTLATAAVAYDAHIRFLGNVQWGADTLLASDGPNQSMTVHVNDPAGLAAGQEIAVGWVITPEFIAEHGMTGTWTSFNGQWRPFFRRRIVAIDAAGPPHEITLDAPTRYVAKTRDMASIRPVATSPTVHGYLYECGMEDLGIANAVDPAVALSLNQVAAVMFRHTADCWMRNVESYPSPHPLAAGAHIQSYGILIENSNRVTVADCDIHRSQHHGGGGNGYLFQVSRSADVLFRDCVASRGRHNFIQNWDFGNTGCVWLRCDTSLATNEFGGATKSEYHHSLAMACLVDSCVINDGWQGGNRGTQSSGAGHSVTESAYWNSTGSGDIGSWNYKWGYVIGTDPAITIFTGAHLFGYQIGADPVDYTEGLGQAATLEPQSLFEDQLLKRLTNGVARRLWQAYE